MAKRKGKRNVKQRQQTSGDQSSNPNCATNANDQSCQFTDNEVERRVAAIVAIRDVEIGQLLTGLRLIRSNLSNEKLQTPFLHYLQENLPNLTVKTNEEDGQFEVEWKRMDANLCVSQADESNMAESILQQISKAYPNFSAAGMPSVGGFEISSKTVNTTDILSDVDFQIPDFVMEEPSESQNLGLQNPFQTPGADSQRLSVGMTPKTLRLPKPGEMLLSVRGSPLGVYKEDNMEAIHESEESQGD